MYLSITYLVIGIILAGERYFFINDPHSFKIILKSVKNVILYYKSILISHLVVINNLLLLSYHLMSLLTK